MTLSLGSITLLGQKWNASDENHTGGMRWEVYEGEEKRRGSKASASERLVCSEAEWERKRSAHLK